MSINLSGFVKNILPTIGKSDIQADLEISLEYFPVIIEGYQLLEQFNKEHPIKSPENKKVIEEIGKIIKAYDTKAKTMIDALINAKANGEWILDTIDDSVNDVVMSQALTALNLNLIRSVPHYFFMTRYASDLLTFIYINEEKHVGHKADSDYRPNKKQMEFITKNVKTFATLLSCYGDTHDRFKSKISKVADIVIPKDDVDEVLSQFADKKVDIFETLPNGFIGSPIYSVRLVLAEWEADRYRDLKDKKKLLELRHLHYKMLKETGDSDINVEKEITYLQKHITELDYKIAKIESSLK